MSSAPYFSAGRWLLVVLCLSSPLQAYQAGHFYYFGHPSEKLIALTFDDGPGRITPALLQYLNEHRIRATFFMEGTQVEQFPAIARQVAAAGHEIGNHTYIHFDYHKAKNAAPARLVHELRQTESSLQRALKNPGFKTKAVRMPYGYFNHSWLLPTLKKEGYALVHWSCDEEPRTKKTMEARVQGYLDHAKPGAVFLFHDGGRHREEMLETLKIVVPALEQKGFRFVAAEDLFQ